MYSATSLFLLNVICVESSTVLSGLVLVTYTNILFPVNGTVFVFGPGLLVLTVCPPLGHVTVYVGGSEAFPCNSEDCVYCSVVVVTVTVSSQLIY